MLGQLTDELDSDDWIVDFCCIGPKSYAFITFKGVVIVKVKGTKSASLEKYFSLFKFELF
jgi:hypothetical protein